MKEFEFALKFALPADSADAEAYVDKLASVGCDDAILGVGQKSRIALQFVREADSAGEAVLSAIGDVKKAIPDARLIEATPDAHSIACP